MLVLSRRPTEAIVVDLRHLGVAQPIVIEVLEFRSGQVRLGITADVSIPVNRHEIHEEIERERRRELRD